MVSSYENRSDQWAKWLSATDIQHLEHSAASLPRGIQLANLRVPHLQVSQIPELIEGNILLRVDPPQGQTLIDQFYNTSTSAGSGTGSGVSTEKAITIIRQCAQALSALHDRKLPHGRVAPDRIYWDSGPGATVICDMIAGQTLTTNSAATGTLGTQLSNLQSHAYLAPEFLAPMQSPSLASDLYALGVTWWWLMTGQTPFVGNTLAETLKAAAHQGLDDHRSRLKLSLPLWLCLMHCLAKNPSARFFSAGHLLQALDLAEQRIAEVQIDIPDQPSLVESLPTTKAAKQMATQATARRKKRKPNWLLPSLGACMSLLALVLILKFSGALDGSSVASKTNRNTATQSSAPSPSANSAPTTVDPLAGFYRVSDSDQFPWAPPESPSPISLDLLPPGAQLVVNLRPAQWMSKQATSDLIKILQRDFDLDELLEPLTQPTGLALDEVSQVTLAFYQPAEPEQFAQYVMRVQLSKPMALRQLESKWLGALKQTVGSRSIWAIEPDQAIFVPGNATDGDAPVDGPLVQQFSLGSRTIVSTLGDTQDPVRLSPQLKRLHQRSCDKYDLTILGSPRFLFSDGRELAERLPQRLLQLIEQQLGKDGRAALIQLHVAESLYWELQLVGASDSDSPRWSSNWDRRASEASAELESWLVEHSPHEYWRGLALRMPQMFRTLREFARFGVEDGAAIANGYLPSESLSSLFLGTWLAVQQFTTVAGSQVPSSGGGAAGKAPSEPMTIEKFLQRKISLSFAQEPIERAVALVGQEANEGLVARPDETTASRLWRFALDGSAFERSGITRNQQLRDFDVRDQSIRKALTEIAKLGNPVTTVQDTRDSQQQLIWIVKDDDQKPGQPMILFTTRTAAQEAGWKLPEEFSDIQEF
jgi:serine/threonine protein kinase